MRDWLCDECRDATQASCLCHCHWLERTSPIEVIILPPVPPGWPANQPMFGVVLSLWGLPCVIAQSLN